MNDHTHHHWYRDFPANQLADLRKKFWDPEQWGWFILLKYNAWNSTKQGALPNEPENLIRWACANTKSKSFKARWAQVLAQFKRRGKWLWLPEFEERLAEIRKVSRVRARAGKASGVVRAGRAEKSDSRQIEWNGKMYFPSQLRKAVDDLDDQIAAHKAKKPSKGGDSHNIWFAQLKELKERRASIFNTLFPPSPAPAGPVQQDLKPAPAPAAQASDPQDRVKTLREGIEAIRNPGHLKDLYYAGERLKAQYKSKLKGMERELEDLEKKVGEEVAV